MNNDDFDPNSTLISSWLQRVRIWMAGLQYGGARDLYAVLGYSRTIQQSDYAARYLRQDIAKRIIDQPVLSTWADSPEILSDANFMAAWKNLTTPGANTPKVWQSIIRLDRLAGLGQFAGLVFGFDDGQDLSQPITKKDGRKLLYLQPYAEQALKVKTYDTNKASPRFGLPVIYTVSPGRFRPEIRTGNAGFTWSSESGRPQFDCHFSRFLHVAEGLLEDSVYGRSRLEVVTNLLDDLIKIQGGGAEAFWLLANRGMQVDVDKEMELSPEEGQRLQQEVEDYQNEIRRIIRTRGVKINPLASDGADPASAFANTVALLSAATGIPQSILIGSAKSALITQQDRQAWSERVSERRTEYAEPVVLRPFIDVLVNAGALPTPTQGLEVDWPEAFSLSPLERAQTSAQMARSAANLTKSQANTPEGGSPLFSNEEARRMVSFDKRIPVFQRTTGSETGSPATPGANVDPVMGAGEEED